MNYYYKLWFWDITSRTLYWGLGNRTSDTQADLGIRTRKSPDSEAHRCLGNRTEKSGYPGLGLAIRTRVRIPRQVGVSLSGLESGYPSRPGYPESGYRDPSVVELWGNVCAARKNYRKHLHFRENITRFGPLARNNKPSLTIKNNRPSKCKLCSIL